MSQHNTNTNVNIATAEDNSSNVLDNNMSNEAEEESNVGDADSDIEDPNIGDLERFMTDDSKIPPQDRTHQMLALCSLYVPGFTTDVPPFNHKIFDKTKKVHKPSRNAMKREIDRRIPNLKGFQNKTLADLTAIIQDHETENPLSDIDKEYLEQFLATYKSACQQRIDELNGNTGSTNSSNNSSRITVDDRMRLIEALLCDDAKIKLTQTQECMTRQELDSRNSELQVVDFFDTVSSQFNDPTFLPAMKVVQDLHPSLEEPRDLPLKEYRTTRSKVKEKYDEMKNQLHSMVVKWELSGNGGMQRSDDADDFGAFDLEEVIDGDNRRNFLPDGNDSLYYLLYFWHRLEEEGFLQFTLAKFPDNVAIDSDNFSTVTSPWVLGRSDGKSGDKAASILAASMQSMTDVMKSQVAEKQADRMEKQADRMDRRRARDKDYLRDLQEKAFEHELKMLDIGEEDDQRYQSHKRRKLELESEIEEMKESLE